MKKSLFFLYIDLNIRSKQLQLPPPGIHRDVYAHILIKKIKPHNHSIYRYNKDLLLMLLKAKFVAVCTENILLL